MNFQFLIGPIVGAVIGYITNSIAIKMLFRPLKPIYLLGIKLPFTPGMIPKERDRIAQTVGEVVGKELIDQDTLKEQLLSQETYIKIERHINEWFMSQKNSERTVRQLLGEFSNTKTVDVFSDSLKAQITKVVYEKVVSLEMGKPLAATACKEIKGNLGALAMFLNDGLIATAQVKLEEIINEMVRDQAEGLIGEMVEKEGEALLDTPVHVLAHQLEDALPKIKYALMKQYTVIVEQQLSQILNSLNLQQVVETKIKSYDLLEMEKLILGIMSKELNAIVWLGALLGGIMGIFMSIF